MKLSPSAYGRLAQELVGGRLGDGLFAAASVLLALQLTRIRQTFYKEANVRPAATSCFLPAR
jgi:hypothetical protein